MQAVVDPKRTRPLPRSPQRLPTTPRTLIRQMQRKLLKSQTNSNPLQSPPEPPLLEKQEVVIGKVVRNKRKCITTVKGLERFGVRLSDASKKHGKKFATGASVVKGPTAKEQIDAQGDMAPMTLFSSLQKPGLMCQKLQFSLLKDGKKVAAV